jgi:hypothetical protein
MIAKTIDEVIENLEQIIQTSKDEESTLGYFAALYQKVTITIKENLNTNYFEDDERMEKLDVIFANRYLSAYSDYQQGNKISKSWKIAFDSSKNNSFIVLQHLLLGMNAHINLDLGIAASEISDKSTIDNLEADFNKINEVLGSLVDEVQNDLARIWPTLFRILKFFGKVDDLLVNFSMNIARNGAWKFANDLVNQDDESEKEALISTKDVKTEKFANLFTSHGIIEKIIFKIIRIGERGNVSDRIEALEK